MIQESLTLIALSDSNAGLERLAIYCADVGSIATNFGWARVDGNGAPTASGTVIEEMAEHLSSDLGSGDPIALGFECPLWVPLPVESTKLGKSRPGESGAGQKARPWSAGAGLGSLSVGLVQAPWLLRAIRPNAGDARATTDWALFMAGGASLFLWEAMVTDTAKGKSHEDDARIGALAFQAALPDPRANDACPPRGPILSLAGAAILRGGWSEDPKELERPCVVIRAGTPN